MDNKDDLLFYNEYEEFYSMVKHSGAFRVYCKDAFGEDFSQDGFSDLNQIEKIVEYIPSRKNVHVLDVGCGNGKMLGYLQSQKECFIHGFDYSKQAIQAAKVLNPLNSEFKQGIIGDIEYDDDFFDLVISMDTIYFAKDMSNFVAQVKSWLKTDGVFFIGYQEGDVMPRTKSLETTEIVKALEQNNMRYEAIDITEQTYKMLQKKRESARMHQEKFILEGNEKWLNMLLFQTQCSEESLGDFTDKMARYIIVAKK